MKKFTKLFLSSALVAAMALTSVVAFADGETKTEFDVTGELKGATYSTETGALTVPATLLAGRDENSQATFLVYEKTEAGTVTQDNVVGIDQTDAATFTQNGLKGKPQLPAEGQKAKTYTVKVGYYKSGTFTVLSGDLKIDTVSADYGDANLDGEVTFDDAILTLKVEAGTKTLTDQQFLNANVYEIEENEITFDDAIQMLKYEAGTGTIIKELRGE